MADGDDTFSEVTTTSWGGKIGGAFKGMLFGLILMAAAAVVLFWNEGRAVKTAQTLEEGAASVISVPADPVDAANEMKLVHVTGEAATGEKLLDEPFGVEAAAIKLARKVEMYQWTETSKSETRKKLGGGDETITTYTYAKGWEHGLIDSSKFKKPQGHGNPTALAYAGATHVAKKVTLGAFAMPASMIAKMDFYASREMTEADHQRIPAKLRGKVKLVNGQFYIPASAATKTALGPEAAEEGSTTAESSSAAEGGIQPQVGDVRIGFELVPPGTVSVIARQLGKTFEPYPARTGNTIELVAAGARSAESMFASEMASNRVLTWVLRAAGFVAMFIGLALLLAPLGALADVLPILGTVVSAGTGVIAFLASAALSLVIIAVAWLAARPIVGLALLAGAVVLIVLGVARGKRKAKART